MGAAHLLRRGARNPRSGRAHARGGGGGAERNERWGGGSGPKGLDSRKGRWLYNCGFSGSRRALRTDQRCAIVPRAKPKLAYHDQQC
jgi:hypothetical protein